MQNVRRRAALGAAATIGALALAFTPTAANAATTAEPTRDYFTMTVGGYDAAVAEANGYQIITNEDGTQESVPVTAAAKARAAALPSIQDRVADAGEVTPLRRGCR